jgi:hypothetical protein
MLPDFINDPLPVIEILEILKDDESEYVRRSVANNLNDISKDHPEIVVAIVKRWLVDTNHERDQLIRHGCRTLIKAGNQKILNTLGYKTPKLKDSKFSILNSTVQFGSELIFKLDLTSSLKKDQKMIIDYIIHYQKANGTTAPKVYKWKVCNLARLDTVTYNKKHKIKKISTRIFYPGLHFLEIIINGTSIGRHEFHLNI